MSRKIARVLRQEDPIANVMHEVAAGDEIHVQGLASPRVFQAKEAIPRYHKIAVQSIEEGAVIHRGGFDIGFAYQPIEIGQWVHIHNLRSLRSST
ncbi:SAF domain-containing protein [Polycladidibacter hongkongensis]|uniref:SAF domain-containing protein n=1 Tax=Polycladidibacter hongkongensis TaxID=1647556 RepID=UPI0008310128|nr:SAF domain-containing protein [Pseudovibrio hongkongensis]